ncbi:sensor histidine kinase [Marinilactibacillus psychrotolerans]|uniref:sensor histidine kinase n=2 Tax=Marinilactibacillus psychrotolerans TaxID=191770 RepID=UPI0016499B72|nr:hypothetical protein [Marinilactibacillus psychrotolerans]
MSFSWIITGFNESMSVYVQQSMVSLISFFPPLFLYFINQNISEHKPSTNKSCIWILILGLLAVLREFSRFEILTVDSNVFFFSNLLLMLFFSYKLYNDNKNQGTLKWKSKEVRLILVAALSSIAPFIVVSLIPAVFFNGVFHYLWTLGFVLVLPVVMGYLLNKNNLILHRYWKVSFLSSYFLVLLLLGLILVILYLSFNPSVMQLIRGSHFFIILGYFIYIGSMLYTQYRKKAVEKELSTFQEERETLTFYQLKNKLLAQDFQRMSQYWNEKWKIAGITLFERDGNELTILFTNENIGAEKGKFSENNNVRSFINRNVLSYEVEINRSYPFSKEESEEIIREIKKWLHYLIEKEELLNLKSKIEDRSYTALEKSLYLREMKSVDVYHDMISRYLHDDVQQHIYYLKQMVFSENSVNRIRQRTEKITNELEKSIKLRTIEWMGYPSNRKEIDRLVYELSQALEEHLPTDITLDMDIDVDSFEESPIEIKSLLYRAIKECMVNTYKHSNAKNLVILLEKQMTHWYLRIEDDGIGWNGDVNSTTRFGLVSLYRQVEAIGGEVMIKTANNKGFKVDIRVPEVEG